MKRPHHGIKSTHPKQSRTTVLQIPSMHSAPPQPVTQVEAPVLPLIQGVSIYPSQAYGTTPGPNLIGSDNDKSIANISCYRAFADKNSGIVYHNLTGSVPFMSYDGSVYFFILYQYKLNSILATLIAGLDHINIFNAYKKGI
jgi:hypothetical protein